MIDSDVYWLQWINEQRNEHFSVRTPPGFSSVFAHKRTEFKINIFKIRFWFATFTVRRICTEVRVFHISSTWFSRYFRPSPSYQYIITMGREEGSTISTTLRLLILLYLPHCSSTHKHFKYTVFPHAFHIFFHCYILHTRTHIPYILYWFIKSTDLMTTQTYRCHKNDCNIEYISRLFEINDYDGSTLAICP